MFNDQMKQFLLTQLPPEARKPAVLYVVNLAMADGARKEAIERGASESVLDVLKNMAPMVMTQVTSFFDEG